MKIKLAAKNNDVKDNYPAGDFDIHLKRKENKVQKQEECINNDG